VAAPGGYGAVVVVVVVVQLPQLGVVKVIVCDLPRAGSSTLTIHSPLHSKPVMKPAKASHSQDTGHSSPTSTNNGSTNPATRLLQTQGTPEPPGNPSQFTLSEGWFSRG
jgi:hypothetical protein